MKKMLAIDFDLDNVRKMKMKDIKTILKRKERDMEIAVQDLDFESAAILRDEIKAIGKMIEGKGK